MADIIIKCYYCGKIAKFSWGTAGGTAKMFGFEKMDYCSSKCFWLDYQDNEEWENSVSQEEFNLRYALAISITNEQNRKYALKKANG